MRSWHTDPITVITPVPGAPDQYGRPAPAGTTETPHLGRATPVEATVIEGRPVRLFDIRLSAGTPVTLDDTLRFLLPEGGLALAQPVAPPQTHRSPHGAASSTIIRVRVVNVA